MDERKKTGLIIFIELTYQITPRPDIVLKRAFMNL